MKTLTTEQISYIQTTFSSLKSKEDFLDLLNKVKKFMEGENATPFSLSFFTQYVNPKFCEYDRYYIFKIKKKSGGERTIMAPYDELKGILQCFNVVLQTVFTPHPNATGFVQGKSIAIGAQMHIGKNYVYNIDLKDFFHSFERKRVKWMFTQAPFNLSEPLAFLLASLCTHPIEIEGQTRIILPQGAPTSPTLTNILSYALDKKLSGLAKRFGATYSRYADDITFSSNKSIFKKEAFLSELHRIITSQGLTINEKKTRLQEKGYRQEVTGLIVNEKVNTYRRYVKQLRMWLHYIETYGYKKAETLFKKDYVKEKEERSWVHMENVLEGKLLYLKMVKGEQDPTCLKLQDRFNKAFGLDIEKLLQVWEREGIEKAEEFYKEMLAIKRTINDVFRIKNIKRTKERIEERFEKHKKEDLSINTAISRSQMFLKHNNPKTAQIDAFLDPERYEKEIAPRMQEKILK
jgi:RNA-directed DNA polymerase